MSRDPLRSHGVLLLLADAPEDVVAARCATVHAAEAGTRLLAAVLLPAIGPTLDPAMIAAGTAVRRQEAAAVGARVQPVVARYELPLTAVPLLLPPVGRPAWTRRRLRLALRLLVGRSGAELVVVPPRDVLGLAPRAVADLMEGGVVAGLDGTRAHPRSCAREHPPRRHDRDLPARHPQAADSMSARRRGQVAEGTDRGREAQRHR